jgi:hypothetical protein
VSLVDHPCLAVAIHGARRLADLVEPSGRFIYSYDYPMRRNAGYNLLRHCGALWSMLAVADRLQSLGRLAQAAAIAESAHAALGWLRRHHLVDLRALDPPLCAIVHKGMVRTGCLGLALLGYARLLPFVNRELARGYLGEMAGLGNYLVGAVAADGADFRHKLSWPAGADLGFASDYYTGEILFGLAELSRLVPDPAYLGQVRRSLDVLAARDYGVAQHSHWMLYALESAYSSEPSPEWLAYAGRIVSRILAEQAAYLGRNRGTGTACRSEGLAAYLRMLGRAAELGQVADELPLEPMVEACIAGNLEQQLRFYRTDGSFVAGGASRRVQIDYIQHNISAFLAAAELGIEAATVTAEGAPQRAFA